MSVSGLYFSALHEAVPPDVERERGLASDVALEQIDSSIEQMGLESSRLSLEVLGLLALLPREGNRLLSSLREIGGTLGQVVGEFGRRFRDLLSREQADAVEVGAELIERPVVQAAIDFGLPQATLPVLDDLIELGSSLITGLEGDVIRQINTEIRLAALGEKTIDEAMARVRQLLPETGDGKGIAHRARAIVETEVGRVQSMSAQLRLEALADQIPDLAKQWRHSGNIRNPRSGHQAISGTVVEVGERFMVAPTAGGSREAMLFPRDPAASARNTVLCFTGDTHVRAGSASSVIRSLYQGDLMTVETSRGYKLTGTPNHPILTRSGWVPMGLLNKSMDVVSSIYPERVGFHDFNIDDMPSTFQEVYDAALIKNMVMGMDRTLVNLYGRIPDRNVDIVDIDSNLAGRIIPEFFEPGDHRDFASPDFAFGQLFVNGRSSHLFDVPGSRLGSDGCMCSLCVPQVSFFAPRCHLQLIGFLDIPDRNILSRKNPAYSTSGDAKVMSNHIDTLILSDVSLKESGDIFKYMPIRANRNSIVGQPLSDHFVSDIVVSGYGLNRFHSQVSFDHIVDINAGKFDGHVYTLQSDEGLYMANGIVAMNCRCQLMPFLRRWEG